MLGKQRTAKSLWRNIWIVEWRGKSSFLFCSDSKVFLPLTVPFFFAAVLGRKTGRSGIEPPYLFRSVRNEMRSFDGCLLQKFDGPARPGGARLERNRARPICKSWSQQAKPPGGEEKAWLCCRCQKIEQAGCRYGPGSNQKRGLACLRFPGPRSQNRVPRFLGLKAVKSRAPLCAPVFLSFLSSTVGIDSFDPLILR